MAELKRTPLYEAHARLGGRLIDFGGWEMPVQYSGIMDEHQTVRTNGGIFDISHMGEFFVRGPGASAFLNFVLTNDITLLKPGQAQYTLMCNATGGVVDDLYVYCLQADEFLLIVNSSRIDADAAWLTTQLRERKWDCEFKNASDEFGAVAVQGSRIVEWIDQLIPSADRRPTTLSKNEIATFSSRSGSGYVARTGYTGEDGFEVIAPAADIEALWNGALELGRASGLKPAGLGARDTLRTEMCYPLYGHELNETITPLEAGVGFFVALNKGDFIGRETLAKQKAEGLTRRCAAFTMTEKGAPPRPGYPICAPGGDAVGEICSGTLSPSLGIGIGLGYLPTALAKAGTAIEVEIRGRRYGARVVPKPIYRKAG